ncbi:MAG: DNA cytosine methyltransferase [Vulcanimicrobiaceae bacterium]
MTQLLRAANIYSGAGGAAEGFARACAQLDVPCALTCVNHNADAVASNEVNHPNARHLRMNVDNLRMRDLSRTGRLDILLAEPACTEHSYAKGGASLDYLNRASAWAIVREVERYRPRIVIVENVPPFLNYGPVEAVFNGDGSPKLTKGGEQLVRPIKARRGETFRMWFGAMESAGGGYKGQWRIVNAADYGAPQTRRRLFMVFTAPGVDYVFPEPQFGPPDAPEVLSGNLKPYTPARSVIKLGLASRSIFRPLFGPNGRDYLAEETIRRLAAGVRQFCGEAFISPFLVVLRRHATARSLDGLLPSVLAGGRHIAVAEPVAVPLILGQHGGSVARDATTQPMPTVPTAGFLRVAEPYLVRVNRQRGLFETAGARCYSLGGLIPPVTTKNGMGLANPVARAMERQRGFWDREDPRIVKVGDDYWFVDVLFRMLDIDELLLAQGFPAGYRLVGGRGSQTMQVGNAVEVLTATAIYLRALVALGLGDQREGAA